MPVAIALTSLLIALVAAPLASAQSSTADLKRMTLKELLDLKVTTASRGPEAVVDVAAAIFVITQEDIRRSGATSIPEALRLAPGVQVARISAGVWAIGVRGFADRLARSILVLIDGRAVYSPLFAGTYWETQDTVLADVDRIEVIRGPGGTLWGSNAVDGIINIITRRAADTKGLLVTAGGGSEDQAFGSVRYGGQAGSLNYRAYFKAFDRGPEFHPDGNDYDGWRAGQGGFRGDWTLAGGRGLTIQGDVYDGRLGERNTLPLYQAPFSVSTNIDAPLSGQNVLARFTSPTRTPGDVQIQAYFDHTNRSEIPVAERRSTFDFDFQQRWRAWPRFPLVWGAGYRVSSGDITAVPPSAFIPETRTDSLYSGFIQQTVVLAPNRWKLMGGAKIEHNDYTGVEVQPSIRLLWTPTASQTTFASLTRAVRTPSRVETDYTTTSLVRPGDVPTYVRLLPNPGFVSERLLAYEVGYRVQPTAPLFVTISTFYNHLTDTLSTELTTPFIEADEQSTRLILPVSFRNGLHGASYGAELTSDFRPAPWWRVTANYSYLSVVMTKSPGSTDVSQVARDEGLVPHHTFQFGSSVDVGRRWSFDWLFRHVSSLPAGNVPGYNASTLRAGWSPIPQLELNLVGQDLFSASHLEWPPAANGPIAIARSVYVRATWRR